MTGKQDDFFVEFTNADDQGLRILGKGSELYSYSEESEKLTKIRGKMLCDFILGSDISSAEFCRNISFEANYRVRKKAEGKLVSVHEVRKDAGDLGQFIKNTLYQIPPKFSAWLAVETDEFEISQRLRIEIDYILQYLADTSKKWEDRAEEAEAKAEDDAE